MKTRGVARVTVTHRLPMYGGSVSLHAQRPWCSHTEPPSQKLKTLTRYDAKWPIGGPTAEDMQQPTGNRGSPPQARRNKGNHRKITASQDQQLIRLGACCTTVQALGVVVGWHQRRPRVVLDRPELELRPRVLSQWR